MPIRILVVHEDPDIAAYLVSLFRQAGHITEAVTEGVEATEMVELNTPDIIFLDTALPGRWGPRFYQWLTNLPGCEHTPFVLVTDFAGLELMVPNAVGTVDKPFDPDVLLELVAKALARLQQRNKTLPAQ